MRLLPRFLLPFLAACDATSPPATLGQIEREVFSRSCVFSSCHKGATGAAGLSLEPPSFARLVDRPSTQVPARKRVVPGDPDASYLLEKVRSERPSVGVRMPPAAPLPADSIELIRSWIAAGAAND